LCYYIKIKTTTGQGLQQKYHYLYADNSGKMRSSGVQPIPSAGYFKFTKSLDGSFFVYSMAKVIKQRTNNKNLGGSCNYNYRAVTDDFSLTFKIYILLIR
jgi:hypothetical protein